MPARVLLIEDNKENLELMTYLLKAYGHIVFTAGNGREGVEAARRELPDLILSDLQMPIMDGYGVARIIRGDSELAKLPMIAVTAYAMRGDRERVLAAGFDGYISKPIVPEEFVSQVEAFLDPGLRAVSAPEPGAADSHTAGPVERRATILVVDDSPINVQLMQGILQPFGYEVITAQSASDGLDLVKQNPPDLILSDFHMPDQNGDELLAAVKADPSLKLVPFVIISPTGRRDGDRSRAENMGARRFIERPIEPANLVAEIEACLAERKDDWVLRHARQDP
jgi:CheY-like chemotaxis protein